MSLDRPRTVAVLGPTAAGKSALGIALAEQLGGEVLSVDSMQVYREMDIGTAKPDARMRRRVAHHLIDLVDPSEEMTVGAFRQEGLGVLDRLAKEGTVAVIVGGSGLYFRALVDPMSLPPTDTELRDQLEASPREDLVAELLAADPDAARHIDLANRRRVLRAVEVLRLTGLTPTERSATAEARALRAYQAELPFTAVGIDPGDELKERVALRFDAMLHAGLLEEVRHLAPRLGRTARQATGYKELLPVVAGDRSLDGARQTAIAATRALAKRQRTFFRRDPRIRWIPWHHDPDARIDRARQVLDEEPKWTS